MRHTHEYLELFFFFMAPSKTSDWSLWQLMAKWSAMPQQAGHLNGQRLQLLTSLSVLYVKSVFYSGVPAGHLEENEPKQHVCQTYFIRIVSHSQPLHSRGIYDLERSTDGGWVMWPVRGVACGHLDWAQDEEADRAPHWHGPFCKSSDRSGWLILHYLILVQVYDSPLWFVSIHFHIATATFRCCVFLPI